MILGVADGAVLIWSLLNWIGIVLEMVGSSIKKHGQYKVLKGDCDCASATWHHHQYRINAVGYLWISDVAERRLSAMFATPHLLMSWLSQFYFLTGVEVWLYGCIWSIQLIV